MISIRGAVYRFLRPAFPRPMVLYLKNCGHERIVGVEIGVDKGLHAKNILETLNVQWLLLVDPYLPYKTRGGEVGTADNYKTARYNLRNFLNVRWLIRTSKDAFPKIPWGLDFVYLDGDHSYEVVKWEIEAYFQKVKRGGVLGGHNFSLYHNGVARAASEFVHGRKDISCFSERQDWWIVKK